MRERLVLELATAGIPVDQVIGEGPGVILVYTADATQADRDAGAAFLAAFDWSQAAHDAWLLARRRAEANAILADGSGLGKLIRAVAMLTVDQINLIRGEVVGIATAVWDPANMANGTGVTSPAVVVEGAAFFDVVDVAAPYTLNGVTATAYVSAAGQVQVRLENQTGGAVNLASGTWGVCVRRPVKRPSISYAEAADAIAATIASGAVD